MAIQNSSPYNAKFPSGPTPWMLPAPVRIAPLSLDDLQRGLGNGLLNASRTSIDQFRLGGLQNDDPVLLTGQRKLPKTGLNPVDNALEKVTGVADYVPQATQDALTTALRWGLMGGATASAATAATLVLLAARGHYVKSVPGFRLVLTTGYGVAAGLTLGAVGFISSLLQNLRDVNLHLAKDPSELKAQKIG